MKRIISLALVLIMTLCAIACASGEGAAGEPVTIRVATYRAEDEAIYAELVKMFNAQHPEITVEMEFNADQASYEQNLQADIMNGTAPDVFDMHTDKTYVSYAQDGHLLPQDDMSYVASYQAGAKEISSVDGKNYGFINAYNMISVLYNKEIFAKENLSEPADFDAFLTLYKTLREKGYGGVSYPGGAVSYNWLCNALLTICLGGNGFKDLIEGMDSGKYTDITQLPGLPEALKSAQAYRDNGVFYDGAEATALDQCISLFAQEKAPMMMMGTWTFGTRDTDFPGLDVGVFALPMVFTNIDTAWHFGQYNGKNYAGGAQVTTISAASENVDAAKLWVEFLASPEASSYYCSNAKMISTIEGVTLDFEGGEVLAAAAANGVEVLPTYTRNNKDLWNEDWKVLLNGLVFGDLDYDSAIQEYVDTLTKLDIAGLS